MLGIEADIDPMPAAMDSAPTEAAPAMSTASAESLGTSAPVAESPAEDDTLSYFAKLAQEN